MHTRNTIFKEMQEKNAAAFVNHITKYLLVLTEPRVQQSETFYSALTACHCQFVPTMSGHCICPGPRQMVSPSSSERSDMSPNNIKVG